MERLHTASRNDEPFSNNSCLQPMVGDVIKKQGTTNDIVQDSFGES